MIALSSLIPIHRRVDRDLPWYVNGTLRTEESRQVEAHLTACAVCRCEADRLRSLLSAHAAATIERPIKAANLDALFDRIGHYEAERAVPSHEPQPLRRESLGAALFTWLVGRPALAAGTFAAVLLAVLVLPTLNSPVRNIEHRVLSSEAPAEALRIRLRFASAPEPSAVQRLVESSLGSSRSARAYRIEQRSATDYVVVLEQRPGIAAVSKLLTSWRSAPNVADVAVDDADTGR